MTIFEFAMQMEKDGESYYREIVKKIENKGIKHILNMLADEEVKHYNLFFKLQNNEIIQMSDTPILWNVKNIFLQMKEEKDTAGVDSSQISLYKKAQGIEKRSQDFYLEKANEVKDDSHKKVFRKIANEEQRHYDILENIINFVSQPDSWLENPEWYHLDEY